MRCSICDFSKETPSEYYGGLHIPHFRYNKLRVDTKTNQIVCSVCAGEIQSTYREFEFEDEAMGIDASAVSVWDFE